MTTNPIHIVVFDVPYPPNYGGIIDAFYKLKALHEEGVRIIYHCFYYDDHNPPNEELEKYCEKVYYYPRVTSKWKAAFGKLPYIVSSRNSSELLENLIQDDYPILFEGLHTCYFLNNPAIAKRKRIVRAHNIEHDYYNGLAQSEKSWVKKRYYLKEADRLRYFERELKDVDAILSIAKQDVKHFAAYAPTYFIPAFFKTDFGRYKVNKSGIEGKYILFQGNLSVKENETAVKFILNEIAPKIDFKFVIAGKQPSQWLKNEIKVTPNVLLVDTPPSVTMEALIQHAHINLLLTFQQTGVKLKLLHALQSGQHVIINSMMDDDGIFKNLCQICDTPTEMINVINNLMPEEISETDLEERKRKFSEIFDNKRNAEKIVEIINS